MAFSQRMLASYWVPSVTCGSAVVSTSLTEILKYKLPSGKPQTNLVFLAFGRFFGKPDPFNPKCVRIDQGVLDQIAKVKQLQAAGIKVVLSIVGNHTGLGWGSIPYGQGSAKFNNMINFAQWVTGLIQQYGLDGIDIDDEFADDTPSAQGFMDTVGILKYYLAQNGKLLTKPLWADAQYFQMTVSSDAPYNANAKLSELLDLGCTMSYGLGLYEQKVNLNAYLGYGMTNSQLCVGVQAGNWDWCTPLSEVKQIADWLNSSSFILA